MDICVIRSSQLLQIRLQNTFSYVTFGAHVHAFVWSILLKVELLVVRFARAQL